MNLIEKVGMLPKLDLFNTLRIRNRVLVYRKSFIGIESNCKITNRGIFHLGFNFSKTGFMPSTFTMRKNSQLVVSGDFAVHSGYRISVNENAVLELGSGYINCNANIACFLHIKIGHNVAISENVTIRDSDNHRLQDEGYVMSQPIEIGNHVWIGMNVTILKGVRIGDGAVVAAGAIVTKNVPDNCLVAGVPARVIKENVSWK